MEMPAEKHWGEVRPLKDALHDFKWALGCLEKELKSGKIESPIATLRDIVALRHMAWILYGHKSKITKWLEKKNKEVAKLVAAYMAGTGK